ncbi:MAG: DUF4174 domain-containing protein [Gemmatimonadota bacterium]|nr:DUF4174 domain-containing protein [Gemmatimonadota bacterium]
MRSSPLHSFRWRNRPLLVFAPSAVDPRLAEQVQRVEAKRAGFEERDMVLLEITTGGESRADGAALRERFRIKEDVFAVVLVGKDGTEKCRWTEPVEMRELWELIDAMPMRRREMREGAQGEPSDGNY